MNSLVMGCFGSAKMENTSPSSTTLPDSMTATRPQISFTASIWWVMSTTVMPSCWLSRLSSCKIEWVVWGSSALVASSQSRTVGLLASARAMATRCFWPPESWLG